MHMTDGPRLGVSFTEAEAGMAELTEKYGTTVIVIPVVFFTHET